MEEKRRHYRKPVEYPVQFEGPGGVQGEGICRDLSLGGMQIEAETAAPFGSTVTVAIHLNSTGDARLPAIVRWVKPGSMGLQFGLLGAKETYGITQALAANAAADRSDD